MKKIPLPRSSIVVKKIVNLFLSVAKTKKPLQSIAIQKKNMEKLLNVPGVCYTVFTAQYYTAVFKYIPLG